MLDLITEHLNQLPGPRDHIADDPLTFTQTVGALLDFFLTRRTDASLLLHRLVQAVIRQAGPAQNIRETVCGPDDPAIRPRRVARQRV